VACVAPSYVCIISHINSAFVGKTLLNVKCMLWFSLKHLSKTILILGVIQRRIIDVHSSSYSRHSWQNLIKLGFSRQIFEKNSSNIKFYENPSSWSRLVPCGQADWPKDGRSDKTRLMVLSRNVMNAPKNLKAKINHLPCLHSSAETRLRNIALEYYNISKNSHVVY
jgi:hypothetical protein